MYFMTFLDYFKIETESKIFTPYVVTNPEHKKQFFAMNVEIVAQLKKDKIHFIIKTLKIVFKINFRIIN